jgi:cell pole-organizing protein PopZ
MSENNYQEDLSVEDILSSIKNILVDENGAPIENSVEPEITDTQINIAENNINTEIEDVFNLDDSMIIPEATSEKEDDITSLLEETTEAPVENSEIIIPAVDEDIQQTDIDVQETLALSENIDINNILSSITTEEEHNLEVQNDTPILPQEQEDIVLPIDTVEESALKEETVDASASIINNFAKVFAEKQQEHNQQTVETATEDTPIEQSIQSSIEQVGIGDMVRDAITKQVKESLNNHFEQIASSIISKQTQQWLNDNLAAIVERTVAKEIERVIAKVGS